MLDQMHTVINHWLKFPMRILCKFSLSTVRDSYIILVYSVGTRPYSCGHNHQEPLGLYDEFEH